MYKVESIPEKEAHKILQVFEIQADHSVSAGRTNQLLNQKKEELVVQWILPFQHTTEQKQKKFLKILRPCQRTKKAVEHEGGSDTYRAVPKTLKRDGGTENQNKNRVRLSLHC